MSERFVHQFVITYNCWVMKIFCVLYRLKLVAVDISIMGSMYSVYLHTWIVTIPSKIIYRDVGSYARKWLNEVWKPHFAQFVVGYETGAWRSYIIHIPCGVSTRLYFSITQNTIHRCKLLVCIIYIHLLLYINSYLSVSYFHEFDGISVILFALYCLVNVHCVESEDIETLVYRDIHS